MVLFLIILRYPLLRLYDAIVWLRNLAYRHGWKKVKRLDRFVISVGNLSMGGAGKTPVTAALAGMLLEKDLRVTVLSRGYGRREADQSRHVTPDSDWRLSGDEPLMLARQLPRMEVLVGPSRWQAAQAATGQRPDVYLIDDGFQHRALHRDMDIVLIDGTQPLPIPLSPHLFREHLPALDRAHLVLVTRCKRPEDAVPLQRRIHSINPHLPVFPIGIRTGKLVDLHGNPLDLEGRQIAAFAGIARPEQFFETLRQLGIHPKITLSLPDHRPLTGQQKIAFESRLRREGISRVISTHKDAVKLAGPSDSDIIYGFLSIEIDWMGARDQVLHYIMERVDA